MRCVAFAVISALTLSACSGGGETPAGAPQLKLGPKDGAWSEHTALEGPMAVWGPPELGKEVLSVTCLPAPRNTLVVTLFKPALVSGKPATGELTLRTDGKAIGVPLAVKDDGAEARLPLTPTLVQSWSSARDLRFEVKSAPGDGADTGQPSEALKRVLQACKR